MKKKIIILMIIFLLIILLITTKVEIREHYYIKHQNNSLTIIDFYLFTFYRKSKQPQTGIFISNGNKLRIKNKDEFVYLRSPSYSFSATDTGFYFKWDKGRLKILKTVNLSKIKPKKEIILDKKFTDDSYSESTEYILKNEYSYISISDLLVNKKGTIHVLSKDYNISSVHEIIFGPTMIDIFLLDKHLFSFEN